MRQPPLIALAALIAACGGGQSPRLSPASQAPSPEAAVQSFMAAVADSNITLMGHYWGTSRGPASATGQPSDHQRRLTVTQLYLRNAPFKIVKIEAQPNDPNRQTVTVELNRRDCIRSVPFTTIKTGRDGWIVVAIDLTQAGTPGRPCANVRNPTSPPSR